MTIDVLLCNNHVLGWVMVLWSDHVRYLCLLLLRVLARTRHMCMFVGQVALSSFTVHV